MNSLSSSEYIEDPNLISSECNTNVRPEYDLLKLTINRMIEQDTITDNNSFEMNNLIAQKLDYMNELISKMIEQTKIIEDIKVDVLEIKQYLDDRDERDDSDDKDEKEIKKKSKYGDYKLYSNDPILRQELLQHCRLFLDKLYSERPGHLINSLEVYDLFNDYLLENKYNKVDNRLAKQLMTECKADYRRRNRKIYILMPGRVILSG